MVDGAEAIGGGLRETAIDQVRYPVRDGVVDVGQAGDAPGQDALDRADGAVGLERPAAGEHLVEDDAQREEVGAAVGALAPQLFRRHVAHRAHQGGGPSRLRPPRQRAVQRGQAEVEDLHPAVDADEDVLRLEIAVHDAAGVSGGEPSGNLERDLQGGRERQRAGAEPRPQRFALEAFGDEVRGAAVVAHVIHRDDIGVIEGAGGPGFVVQRREALAVGRMRQQQLDRHVASDPLVPGAPHFAGAAGAEPALDRVRPDRVAGPDAPALA